MTQLHSDAVTYHNPQVFTAPHPPLLSPQSFSLLCMSSVYANSIPKEFYADTRGWVHAKGASWQGCEYYVDNNNVENKTNKINIQEYI